jgi:hypothetical protein
MQRHFYSDSNFNVAFSINDRLDGCSHSSCVERIIYPNYYISLQTLYAGSHYACFHSDL